jgi:plasmid stability protein
MATLNIKKLPDKLYRQLRKRALAQHRSIAQEVTHVLSEALEASGPLSLLALRGLGKEHWARIDAAKHVRAERRSWD